MFSRDVEIQTFCIMTSENVYLNMQIRYKLIHVYNSNPRAR